MKTAKRTHYFLKALIYSGIVAGFCILAALGWISVEASRSFKQASYWRTHSAEVISKLNRIMGRVLESESGQRGYLLTGDPRFLKAHEEAKAEMPTELHELAIAVKDNWEQSIRVEQMSALIRGFGGYLSDTIRQHDRGDKRAANIRVQKGEGLAYSQRLRELYLEFLHDEERLLAARTQDYEQKARRLELFIKYAVSGSIFLLLISVMFLGLENSRRRKIQEELVGARQKALDASAMKSTFLANMSHEIRTPMNGILGMSELLLKTRLSGEQTEFAVAIQDSARALLALINDILDISKIESGKLQLEQAHFCVKTVTDSLRGIFEYTSRHKGIPFAVEIDSRLQGAVIGDPLRLRQVLINLVGNAFKFSQQGKVTISVVILELTEKTIKVRFSVQDQGVGFSEETRKKLFSAFTQADSSTTRKFGGSGLGLAISQELISRMGGQIQAESTPNVGSRFWFDLQFELGDEQKIETASFSNTGAVERQPAVAGRILVVEDNQINQKVAKGMLEKMGHQVVLAGDGLEALKALSEGVFDLVLMDCHMPNMDGYEATGRIRSSGSSYYNIPIIATTANAVQGDREKSLAAGMDDYISKPMDYEDLFFKIEALLKTFKKQNSSLEVCQLLNEGALDKVKSIEAAGSPGLLGELIEAFLATAPAELEQIRAALEKEDFKAVQELTHKLKSSCRTLGLEHMGQMCEDLELNVQGYSAKERARRMVNLDRCFQASKNQIEKVIQGS